MIVRQPTRVYRSWPSDSRRWNAYRPRAGDIVIATYPKSGTTWMQQIVSLLIFQSPEPRPIADIAPWLDMRPLQPPAEEVMARLDAQSHRRFLKCHVPLDGMAIHDDVKYIHVARDGRDACLSYHNHCLGLGGPIIAAMDKIGQEDETIRLAYPRPAEDAATFFRDWMREGVGGEADGRPFGSWFNFEATYWAERAQPNLLMVHYRDLKRDLAGEMRRIAGFLDITVSEALWPQLVKAATFEEMRRVGNQLHPTIARVMMGGADRFFQKGENDRWRDVLEPEDVAQYQALVRQRLEPDCAAWLERGWSAGTL